MSESHIGIRLADGSFFPILEKTALGRKRLTLSTVHDNQEMVQVSLYQQADAEIDPEYIGTLVIERLASAPSGTPDVRLVVGIDDAGNLNATATDVASGEYQSLSVSLQSIDEDSLTAMPDFALDDDEPMLADDEPMLADESLSGDESESADTPTLERDSSMEEDFSLDDELTLDELTAAADDGSPSFDDLTFDDPESAESGDDISADGDEDEPISLELDEDPFDESLLSLDDEETFEIGDDATLGGEESAADVAESIDDLDALSVDGTEPDEQESDSTALFSMDEDETLSDESLSEESVADESLSDESLSFDDDFSFDSTDLSDLDLDSDSESDSDVMRSAASLDRKPDVPSYDEDQERSERPGIVLFLGFVLLALAALGFLTYIIFRAIETPDVPAIGAFVPLLVIRPAKRCWRRPRAVR